MEARTVGLINLFKLYNIFPKNIEAARIGKRFWFVCYDKDEGIMSENSSTGFSYDPDTALLKALSERMEQVTFQQGIEKGLSSCATERSDGFAAYPLYEPHAKKTVRDLALSEAIERYVWATWWDNHDIKFEKTSIFDAVISAETYAYFGLIEKECQTGTIFIIEPKIKNLENKKVLILIAHLDSGGFISGGACGSDFNETIVKAADELFRHGLAIKKMQKKNLEPKTFYERRLAYFGFGNGNHLVKQRLTQKGKKEIELPSLAIDEPLESVLKYEYAVHRCLFENQPPFVGGELERLCL